MPCNVVFTRMNSLNIRSPNLRKKRKKTHRMSIDQVSSDAICSFILLRWLLCLWLNAISLVVAHWVFLIYVYPCTWKYPLMHEHTYRQVSIKRKMKRPNCFGVCFSYLFEENFPHKHLQTIKEINVNGNDNKQK